MVFRHVRIPSVDYHNVSMISPYCTAAQVSVTSVAFNLIATFIIRLTCNSALDAEHYYSYLLPFFLLLQLSWCRHFSAKNDDVYSGMFLLMLSSVDRQIRILKFQTESRFFVKNRTEPIPRFLGELNRTVSQKSILHTPTCKTVFLWHPIGSPFGHFLGTQSDLD